MASKAPSPEPLHQATDLLNSALLDAEDALRQLNLGVTASVPIENDRALLFRKHSSDWGLAVVKNSDGSELDIVSTSRRTRLEVAAKLPSLRDAMFDVYEDELRRVDKAIKAVQAFTASVRAMRQP